MAEVTVTDLTPDAFHEIQVRAYNSKEKSPWSPIFVFQTNKDMVKPAAPTGLTITPSGSSFIITWTKPTTNEDGTPLLDLKDYVIVIGDGVYSTTFYATSERFEFTLEQNISVFVQATAAFPISVSARDNGNNVSTPVTGGAVNPPPAAPTNVTAFAVQGGITISWDANTTDADFKKFAVHASTDSNFVASAANKVWEGDATSWTYMTLTLLPFYIEVRAVDVMNASAGTRIGPYTPIDPFYIDTTPPGAVTGFNPTANVFNITTGRAEVTLGWTASSAPDIAGYSIAYSTSSGGIPSYISVGEDVTSATIVDLLPGKPYYFSIRAFDYDANYSTTAPAGTYPYTTAADLTDPAQVGTPTIYSGATTVTILWPENTDADVIRGKGQYEVQLDSVNTFNSGSLRTAKTSAIIASFTGLTTSTTTTPATYYARVRAIDAGGRVGPWSATASNATLTPGQIVPQNSLNGDVLVGGTVAGAKVIAGDLDADRLKANTGIAQNLFVESTLVLGPDTGPITQTNAGVPEIRSGNYATDPVNGFRLTSTGLDIRSGTIQAKALLIQTASNLMPSAYAGWEMAPAWYTGKIASSATNPVVVSSRARFQSQSLEFTAGASGYIYFAPTTTATNIAVEPGKAYIVSWYGQAVSGSVSVQPILRNQSTVDVNGTMTAQAAGTWTRYSQILTTPAGSTNAALFFNTSGGGVGGIDGIQVEEQTSGATAPSAWNPPGLTSIDGDMIKTGSISSSTGAWSINLNGNATFSNANITGTLVVNNSSSYAIQSGNYSAGSTGWVIRGDGYAEFASGAFRGNITGAYGTFSGGLNIGNYAFNVDTSGNLWMGATTFANAAANGKFRVDSAGNLSASNANISGSITANSVSTTYTYINSSGTIGTNSGYFNVNTSGQLYAVNATLAGKLTVGSGSPGGNIAIYLDSNGIYYNYPDTNSAFWVNSAGNLRATGINVTGNINSNSVISSSALNSCTISTAPSGSRVEIGPSSTGISGYHGIKFWGYNNTYGWQASGIEAGSDYMNLYTNDASKCKLQLAGAAGVNGQIGMYLDNTYIFGVNTSGISIPGSHPISHGTALGQKYNILNDGSYGIGVQDYTLYFRTGSGYAWFQGGSHSNGQNQGGTVRMRLDSVGQLFTSTGTVQTSTLKVKTDIASLENPIEFLNRFRPVTFRRTDISEEYNSMTRMGFIAEEVEEFAPELIGYEPDGKIAGVDYVTLIAPLVKAVQELNAKVASLESQLTKKP